MELEVDNEKSLNWSFEDNSFLPEPENYNESNVSCMGTYGLENLSCSLIHCDADGDKERPLFDVEMFIDEVLKRDKLISTLTTSLEIILKNREDGDNLLSSVENKVTSLHHELNRSRDLLRTFNSKENKCKSSTNVNNKRKLVAACTQTKAIDSDKKVLKSVNVEVQYDENEIPASERMVKKVFRSVSTSVSPKSQLPVTSPVSVNVNAENQLDNSFEFEENNSHKLAFTPLDPDSLRLTFSPSIKEYEAETYNFHRSDECRSDIVDDLKLQVSDAERKLEATKKYLDEMTIEREQERDEFLKTINELTDRYEEIKKDKEKLENKYLQQKHEIDTMEERQRNSELNQDILIKRTASTEHELKIAVEKICELQEIIRGLEEHVEEATREATMLSDVRRGITEESIHEESRYSESEFHKPNDDGCTSDLDYTEELQAQVHDLAKRIEEKLIELENFPWQARSNSSCSVKSGDDISVRAPAKIQHDDSAVAFDFVAQVFGGLRRLECSFDSLVRFEEVMLKKIRDAELKVVIEAKRQEDLNSENKKMRTELVECRKKIRDFESFLLKLNRSQKQILSPSIPAVEALRTAAHNVSRQFEESRFQLLSRGNKGQLDKDDLSDDGMDDIEQGDEYDDANKYGMEGTRSNNENPQSGSNRPNNATNSSGSRGSNDRPRGKNSDSTEDFNEDSTDPWGNDKNDFPIVTSKDPRKDSKNRSRDSAGSSDNPENALFGNNDSGKGSKRNSSNSPRSSGSLENKTPSGNAIEGYQRGSDGSGSRQAMSGLFLETELDLGDSDNSPNSKRQRSNGSNSNDSGIRNRSSTDPTDGSNQRPGSEGGKRNSGMGHNEDGGNDPADDLLTYNITTVSDYEVDGDNVKYMGSRIIPSDDPTDPDAQASRLSGTSSQVHVETLKTQLEMLQKALEAERQKTNELANQLEEIFHGSEGEGSSSSRPGQYNSDASGNPVMLGQVDASDIPHVQERMYELERRLQEKSVEECRLRTALDCAKNAFKQLQEENQEQRSYISELEHNLEYYYSLNGPDP